MVLAATVAFWKGWRIHHGEWAAAAFLLGILALTLGIWHLTRKAAPPRV